MRWLRFIGVFIVFCAAWGGALFGCTTKDVEQFVTALAKVPFVDRTEKDVNDWFYSRTIIDDKPMTSGVVNGDPRVLLIHEGPKLNVNGTGYPGVLCITQTNTFPGGQSVKYAALVGIKVLNNPNLFECGEMDLSEQSCDGDPMAVNVAGFHDKSMLEKAFQNAVNQWLNDDIVKTLKSNTNKEGFANPAAAQPRLPAKVRGSLYNVFEDKGPPVVRTISFVAE